MPLQQLVESMKTQPDRLSERLDGKSGLGRGTIISVVSDEVDGKSAT